MVFNLHDFLVEFWVRIDLVCSWLTWVDILCFIQTSYSFIVNDIVWHHYSIVGKELKWCNLSWHARDSPCYEYGGRCYIGKAASLSHNVRNVLWYEHNDTMLCHLGKHYSLTHWNRQFKTLILWIFFDKQSNWLIHDGFYHLITHFIKRFKAL